MLTIDCPARDIPKREYFDNIRQEFITIEGKHINPIHLQLEHSLMSIAKWESRWHKAFITNDNLTGEELIDYLKCMTINQQKDPDVYNNLPQEELNRIVEYMQDPYSAWEIISNKKRAKPVRRSKRPESVEMVYYAMIQYGIPMECEKWHFNRLMALIDYCDYKGGSTSGAGGPNKRSEKEIMEMYRAMNEKNRKKYHSKG